ncbi:triose-phosphate isomerase [Streptomyces sp. NPDC007088]|uniref:triose-phosphate isomerase n=1 Tax=Streptomyces sp. NPDC007088 TaxID=3364773 RepID=UPI0036A4748D
MTATTGLPRFLSCTNTKALLDSSGFGAWCDGLLPDADALARVGFVVLVPAQLLDRAASVFAGTGIGWGAQDVAADETPPTGDIPASALAASGCSWVMTGHHERRTTHGESDAEVGRKAASAAGRGLLPLVCVGEERPLPLAPALESVRVQAEAVLERLPPRAPVTWLYEPAWTSAAGTPAGSGVIASVCALLRERCAAFGHPTRVAYGGAVTPGVVTGLLRSGDRPLPDGMGLGRAAHDPAQRSAVLSELLDLAGFLSTPGEPAA